VRLIELKGSNLRQFPVTGEGEESAGRRVMTGGVHLAAGGRERGVPVRVLRCWAAG
jgi:hypothetical protein